MRAYRLELSLLLLLAASTACKKPEAANVPAATGKAPKEGMPRVPVSTIQLAGTEVSRTLELTGTLLADNVSNVTGLGSGVVVEVPVDTGDMVKKGDALVRLDDRDARMRVSSAQAALMQARARLGLALEGEPAAQDAKVTATVNVDEVPEVRNARANLLSAETDLKRNEKLFADGAISIQTVELARLKVETSNNGVEMARSGVQQSLAGLVAAEVQVQIAKKALGDMVVRAPYNGSVVKRNVNLGEFAGPQMPLVQLVSIEKLRLSLDAPESAVTQLAEGQDVTLVVQGRAGEEFKGKVSRIAPALDQNTRALRVEALVDNKAQKLKPGMFVQAKVAMSAHDVALFVPRAAVLNLAGVNKVFVVTGDHVEERIVTLGLDRGDLLEVHGQLKVGDRVVAKDVDKLVDGAPVEG